MPVLIVLIVGDALVRMHHVHQAVSLIAVLGSAPDLLLYYTAVSVICNLFYIARAFFYDRLFFLIVEIAGSSPGIGFLDPVSSSVICIGDLQTVQAILSGLL